MAPDRRGLTLIELMVLIALAVIGIGLILPIVGCGCSREAARRTQCINNVKQLGLAMQQYINIHNAFPNAGTYGESAAALASRNPADSVIYAGSSGHFAVATPGDPDVGPLHSWALAVLPYLDNQALYDGFNQGRCYLDNGREDDLARSIPRVSPCFPAEPVNGTNSSISSTDIPVFICPNDMTVTPNKGNLSYAVNAGFSRWHAEGHAIGWAGTEVGGGNGPALDWGQDVAAKTGVMHLGTRDGRAPWDVRTTVDSITDGLSTTLLFGENAFVGASDGTPYSNGVPTNWACPHPNFCTFIASDDVCTKGLGASSNCSVVGDLAETSALNAGSGWSRANARKSAESINSGLAHPVEGSSPFLNSYHAGLVVVGFCDGSTRALSDRIDGAVYSKLITPAGSALPSSYRQSPLRSGDY